MRKADREIKDRSKIDEIIRSTEVCRIAFANNNTPYLVPVSFGYDGECIYVHTAEAGKKIDFLKANHQVCFEFDAEVKTVKDDHIPCKWTAAFKSVIGSGKMEEIHDAEGKMAALNHIMVQYSGKEWAFNEKMLGRVKLWKISIEEISGKSSGY